MKKFLILLFIMSSISAYSQTNDSVYCFSRGDVILLANKIQLLKDSLRHRFDIIKEQDSLIILYKQRTNLFEVQLENKNSQIELIEKQNKLLGESLDLLKPKWYDNKWFWFGNGVLVTLITVLIVK